MLHTYLNRSKKFKNKCSVDILCLGVFMSVEETVSITFKNIFNFDVVYMEQCSPPLPFFGLFLLLLACYHYQLLKPLPGCGSCCTQGFFLCNIAPINALL